MFYSDEVKNEIRDKTDIVSLVSKYVNLKRAGSDYKGLCPFHNEKTASFSVSPSRQTYHCFGCGVGGNVFSFLMDYEGCTFPEAVERLAEEAGVRLEKRELTAEEKRARNVKERMLDLHREAAKYYYAALRSPEGENGRKYFDKRMLTQETQKKFALGFAPQRGGLVAYLKGKGFTDREIIDASLARFDEKYGMQEYFWNRVIFPIMNIDKKVIGFGGRLLGDGEPKYLNSKESLIFEKGRNLYGLYEAKRTRKDHIILCEGYMDVIAMHQAGFTEAVASLGTAFTPAQAMLLKRYTKKLLLIYDSDGAGVKAAIRAIQICREVGFSTRVVKLAPHKDPDEFIKNEGGEAFEKRLQEAENSFYFELEVLEREYDMSDPGSRTDFARAVAAKLCVFEDEMERDNYLKAVASKYMIDPDQFRSSVQKALLNKENVTPRPELKSGNHSAKDENPKRKAEKLLLTALSDHPELFEQISLYVSAEDFEDELCRRVAQLLYDQLQKNAFSPAAIIDEFCEGDDYNEVSGIFNSRYDTIPDDEYDIFVTDLVKKIRSEAIKRKLPEGGEDPLQSLRQSRKSSEELENIHITLNKTG